MNKLAERLSDLRKAKKFTMKQVAEALDVPETTYREWEYGRSIVGEPYMKIAQYYGIGLWELLTGQPVTPAKIIEAVERIEVDLKELKQLIINIE